VRVVKEEALTFRGDKGEENAAKEGKKKSEKMTTTPRMQRGH
jgi:hypothetical protein